MAEHMNRRGHILRSAAKLMIEVGFDNASMDAIADEAGMTKRGLYYHFTSKTELLFAVMSFAIDELESETIAAMVRAEGPVNKLRAILATHAWLITREEDRAFTFLISTELSSLEEGDRRVIAQRLRSYRRLIQAALEELRVAGALRSEISTDVAAHTLMGLVAWLSFWYRDDGGLKGAAIAKMVTEQAMSSVIPDSFPNSRPVGRN